MKLYKKTTIYVVRYDKKNTLQDSAPCCNCLNIMIELNIKRIVFSSSNNNIISSDPKNLKINHVSSGEKMIQRYNNNNNNNNTNNKKNKKSKIKK
jgi:deoxycytidylate deaminase